MPSFGFVRLAGERRYWIYLAFAAGLAEPLLRRVDGAALLLPLTAIIVANLTRRTIPHLITGAALFVAAFVHIALGGSRSAHALNDPLFWGVAAAAACAISWPAGRWPRVAAIASGVAGAAATVAVLLPWFPDFESSFPVPTFDTAIAAAVAASTRIGLPAAVFMVGLWLQATVVVEPKPPGSASVRAAARGALLAGFVLALAAPAAWSELPASGFAVIGLVLGLAESLPRPRMAFARLPVWNALPPVRKRINPASWSPIAVLLLIEILFSLLLLRAPGTGDVSSFWIPWTDTMVEHGLVEGFRLNHTDYPPLSAVTFLGIAKAALWASTTNFIGLKVSLVVLLLVSTYCFWRLTRDMLLTSLQALSLFISGVAHGYVDLFFAPTLILALWALRERRLVLFSAFLAFSCLMKWQPMIIAPFLVLHALSIQSRSEPSGPSPGKRWVSLVGPALALVLLVLAIFGVRPVLSSFSLAFQHTYLSGTAHNFNWLVTYYLEVFHPELYGGLAGGMVQPIHVDIRLLWVLVIRVAFILAYLAPLWRLFRNPRSFALALECALVGYLSYFMLNIGVHENHLFIGTILAAAAPAFVPGTLPRAILVTAISTLNVIALYGLTGAPLGFPAVVGIDVSVILAAVNVVLFIVFWREVVVGRTAGEPSPPVIQLSADRAESL